ncbi:thermonuclease family protein [Candidatus Lucifugimonas marina]|uniref:Lipoprotein n=1 Tax=Candidatus Lucifugimonas marina TaxID=3038979 RepID=A0AAJ6CTH7_9CHLR|nr:hypothetical protein [SAR202 cluster bacterium JH702]MDG0869038.1 hypothetical protein [SAR202 cluster bacterium JH639]WFG35660.1 hypothetical protein GKN94_08125 [SAR202 cluster bacterium JH545]WFG39607.1 hypothetical protein GKO48_08240 [SAR202 cluster bacterium JH1073]
MKTFELQSTAAISRAKPAWLLAFLLLVLITGCSSDAVAPTAAPRPAVLSCPNCELVDVAGVVDANTLSTSIGHIRMYGVYVLNEPADCATQAKERLSNLAGRSIRIEPGPEVPVRIGSNHYYFYTADGISIEDSLIRDGLALAWSQDGKHMGWFLFREAAAKSGDIGCLWHDYQAFQRGEPNEFRIPGLTYRE